MAKSTTSAKCGNCDKTWETSDLDDISNLGMRLDPGSEVPAGSCPECGCLCYLVSEPRKVVMQVEGAVIHDVDCPEGIELHVIDCDSRGMEPNHPELCFCQEYGEGNEHQHVVFVHDGNATIRKPFNRPFASREEKAAEWQQTIGTTHTARLAAIDQAVRDGTYPDTDPGKVAVTVERMLEEGRY